MVFVLFLMMSCTKNDEDNCTACNVEGVEICEVDAGRIQIFENGEERGDVITLPSDLEFDDAAQQLCAEIERQVGIGGDCYTCMGPNTN